MKKLVRLLNKFKDRVLFETRIMIAMMVIMFFVVCIGAYTYNRLTNVVYKITDASIPDNKLVSLEQLLNYLSNAESSVKSYNLTRDATYLPDYYMALSSIDSLVITIGAHVRQPSEQVLIDSIRLQVREKYQVLEAILLLQNNERVTEHLGRISESINKTLAAKNREIARLKEIAEKESESEVIQPEPQKKKGLFKKIFGNKKKELAAREEQVQQKKEMQKAQKINRAIANDTLLNSISKNLKREVAAVKKGQISQLKYLKYKELDLLLLDKSIMQSIRRQISDMKQLENERIASEASMALAQARETRELITIFSATACILLFLVTLVVAGYVRRSRVYSAALARARNEAEDLGKAKEVFLANMSHEIRTPMNAISGFTDQLLQDTNMQPVQKEQVGIIKKSSDHLLQIINDILDFSKIQAGRFEFSYEPFSPAEVVKDVATILAPQVQKKRLNFLLDIHPGTPATVIGDATRLKQVLFNLAGNAIKFTDRGSIRISLKPLNPGEKKNTTLLFSVSDTGIGIPKEQQNKIFNAFEQADAAVSGKYGGTGLGLSISKKLVELQNGALTVESEKGKGTSIRFSLPAEISSLAQPPVKTSQRITLDLAGKKILVADDEEYNRMLLQTILKKTNASIYMAVDGEEAWKMYQQHVFDILLIDLRMPVMSGKELCAHVREHERRHKKASVPVIALTAATSQDEIDEFTEEGIDDYLIKPFAENILLSKMAAALEMRPVPVSEKTGAQEMPHENNSLIDLNELKELSNGNRAFYMDMIRVFISTTREGFGDIEAAASANDWERVANHAHKITPPCRHIGAHTLLRLLKQLEAAARKGDQHESIRVLIGKAKAESEKINTALQKELV